MCIRDSFSDPAGSAPFRDFVRAVHAWPNVASGSMTPPPQVAALQSGPGGLVWTLSMRAPSTIINHDVTLQGRRTDGVTYIMYLLSTKFGNLEDERQFTSGTTLIDFRVERGERIDS
eukprot:7372931-Pyramimonas_sp.AAC.1